jgi:uncharacterized protein (DUF697 family)
MTSYEKQVIIELAEWQREMQNSPSLFGKATKAVQTRINRIIPEKIHSVVTAAIKQMTRTVIFGADFTTSWSKTLKRKSTSERSLEEIEGYVKGRISLYKTTAAAEGAATGFGGILLGFADLPLWLSIKMKLAFEIAVNYGIDIKDYKERIYILHIFQLTFSSQQHRNKIYEIIEDWDNQKALLPNDINKFDWKTFQLEYRDFLDLAKLFQLIPGFGAVVGAYVNHKYTDKLGLTAVNAYRLRRFSNK